ncbi:hypothetical protein [Roseobacter sp.]|uniref:hypothetical protein n=1 Tax=Roseobacter sp. TaxID=1907202 RepID=UPI00385A9A62
MIGALLPASMLNRRALAHRREVRLQTLENSTQTGIVESAETRDYPRIVSAYTIRTPSPGGQCIATTVKLPAFFLRLWAALGSTTLPNCHNRSVALRCGRTPFLSEMAYVPPISCGYFRITPGFNHFYKYTLVGLKSVVQRVIRGATSLRKNLFLHRLAVASIVDFSNADTSKRTSNV